MRDPSRKDDAKNLGIVYGAGAVAALLTLALLLPGSPAPVYEVVVQPAPAPVPAAVPEPEVVEPVPVLEPLQISGDNRLYGTVTTLNGRRYEGYIRWDRNEGSWADLLDANKRSGDHGVRVIHISRDRDRRDAEHVRERAERSTERAERAMERAERARERVRDRVLRIRDLDPVVRIRDRDHDMDLDIDHDMDIDIDHDFDFDFDFDHDMDIDIDLAGLAVSIGQLQNRFQSFSIGFGSAKSGIRFGHVRSIAPLDSNSALFTLKSGEEIELTGGATDLGSNLRALVIEELDGGVVELEWGDIDVVEFEAAPEDASPPSSRLYGTMTTHAGLEFTGYVTWDVDEIYSTDILNGDDGRDDREIPFGSIARIDRDSSRGAMVTLTDGEEVLLRGTNDVDESNNGISVSDPGLGQVKVSWFDFESVRFHEAAAHTGYGQFDGGQALYGTVETKDGDVLRGELIWDCDEAYTWEMLNGEQDGIEFHVEFSQIASLKPISRRGTEVLLKDGRTYELSGSNDVDDGNRGIQVRLEDGDEVLVDWDDLREVRFEDR